MNMIQEMLEIMIGKYLDGEITPSEQRLLQVELDRDPQAKELLEQLKEMHERCSEAVVSEMLVQGETPGDIFEQAWRCRSNRPTYRIARMRGYGRFAVGVAAGLVIGLSLHFVLPLFSSGPSEPAKPTAVVREAVEMATPQRQLIPAHVMIPQAEVMLNVDWYNFTDSQGNKWLVEGIRENKVRPAAYYDGL